ncbi:ribonuclease R [Neisseria animalis]|uniref:Ribonuclease R n=1 Tax=Neisseria animalis TaxID=492 RepID=A0A5P3MSR1_NEIAN|nr:ribonuclease R [Neisseria animalis]QEY24614.1 ribonuclease R [Neisseria animalis]ROW32974.1 ribonuclease R [Neisseria animalis]VEE07481.1 ribonuclease [Neisseria animalis]
MKKNTKSLNLREKDPYLSRERQRYEYPLPSREWIIELLEERGVPQKMENLARELSINEEEYEFFERRLKAMARDGQVLINRRGAVCAADKLALVKCRVEAHKDGFGFAVPLEPTGDGDFVLYERQMRGVMHGDIVTVRPAGMDRRGRREGVVLDIVERAQKQVVGRFYAERGVAILEAEDKRLTQSIALEPESVAAFNPKPGQVVVAEIESYPEHHRPAVAKVIEVLGDYADSGMEIEIAVRKHHLPHQFSDACLQTARNIPDHVRKGDWKGRVDLRDLPLLTIDGETARDFDDAVYAEKIGRNYRLVVAIADVSHYVRPGDGIDADAVERSTSVYFPRRVIPMLPENLSNGICSLNPDVERLCMVCDMVVTYAGNIKEYKFYPAVMRSHARLTYTQVWNWIADGIDHPHKKEIDTLYKLFKILQKKRFQRGAVEFESVETQMIFDDNGKIEKIVPVVRNDAHKLIEECMLAANVCAAEFLLKNKHAVLFRNHLGPTQEKLTALREQLGLLGLHLGGGDSPTPKDYAKLAEQFKDRPDAELLQVMLLRSMQQAVYEPDNDGHFGLAYESYAHFTSPIRRYPDLLVHRAIKAVLQGETYRPGKTWQALGVHTSFCERRADDASRDVESWLKTYYMRDKVGEVFSGKISGMTGFGIFVTLDDIHIDGLVHISDLGEDYFNFRPEIMAIEGERSGIRFNMGDRVVVKVARADLDTSKIDLTLISGGEAGKKRRKAKEKAAGKQPKAVQNPQEKGVKTKKRSKKLSAKEVEHYLNTAAKPSASRKKTVETAVRKKSAEPEKSALEADKPKPISQLLKKQTAKGNSVKIKIKQKAETPAKRKGRSKAKS